MQHLFEEVRPETRQMVVWVETPPAGRTARSGRRRSRPRARTGWARSAATSQQHVDVFRAQAVADLLFPRHVGWVVMEAEPVVQRGEPDPGLQGLDLAHSLRLDAQLGGVGEVGAELEEAVRSRVRRRVPKK